MVLTEGDETVKEYLEIISSEVETAGKIVSDLLDFSRARAAEREEVALCDLVSQVLSRRPPPKTVEVIIKIPVELSPIYVDSRQMRQVLVNLFSNSCQAMPEGGMLTIRAAEGSSNVKFSITDTGCGISEENKQKIFEPLFTTKSRGIGLGLAVTKNLIEINGGSIEVESEEGKGTTVKVILPHKGFEA
jgi:signal transduction histidine kinase